MRFCWQAFTRGGQFQEPSWKSHNSARRIGKSSCSKVGAMGVLDSTTKSTSICVDGGCGSLTSVPRYELDGSVVIAFGVGKGITIKSGTTLGEGVQRGKAGRKILSLRLFCDSKSMLTLQSAKIPARGWLSYVYQRKGGGFFC